MKTKYPSKLPELIGFMMFLEEKREEVMHLDSNKSLLLHFLGSFDVVLHNGKEEQRITLNRSYKGLYVPKMIWRALENFSANSLELIVSDKMYDENDYIRDFEIFKKLNSE